MEFRCLVFSILPFAEVEKPFKTEQARKSDSSTPVLFFWLAVSVIA
jgi:hypothetical protein